VCHRRPPAVTGGCAARRPARRQALVDDVGAAHDHDVPVARSCLRLADGGRYSLGHEPEPGREPHLGGRFVGDDVARRCGRLVLSCPYPTSSFQPCGPSTMSYSRRPITTAPVRSKLSASTASSTGERGSWSTHAWIASPPARALNQMVPWRIANAGAAPPLRRAAQPLLQRALHCPGPGSRLAGRHCPRSRPGSPSPCGKRP